MDAVSLLKSYLLGHNKCNFYRSFYIAADRSVQRVLEAVAMLIVIVLVASHCDSKGSFEGWYEQL